MTDISPPNPTASTASRQSAPAKTAPKDDSPFWWLFDEGIRAILFQVIVIGLVLLAGGYLLSNTLHNLEVRKIHTGFGYLDQRSGFEISQSMVPYSSDSTYGKALYVGLLNTILVSTLGIIFATLIGTLIGVARLSHNWLVARLATVYVESLRNIPLLLQLFVWYGVISISFPAVKAAWNPLPDLFISNRGFHVPTIEWTDVHSLALAMVPVGIAIWVGLVKRATRIQNATGKRPASHLPGLLVTLLLPVAVWLFGGAPWTPDIPVAGRFNIRGGVTIRPELVALMLGLTLYTASFIAEVVRSGILAVSKGQWEAGESLGLSRRRVLNLIVLPQALRVIVPPITNQYLNLTKNSSLAVAIGYPDLVSAANTTLNQTGQAIENIGLIMAAYLTVSLAISAFMNWYNKRIALVER